MLLQLCLLYPSASWLVHLHCIGSFDSVTLILSAEGVMTNGSGMVQFSRGFMRFGRSLPIVPVALRVTVPWNIQTHTLTSNFAANLFWFCFVPWVRLDATVLKPMSQSEVRHAQTNAHAGWICMYLCCAYSSVLNACNILLGMHNRA